MFIFRDRFGTNESNNGNEVEKKSSNWKKNSMERARNSGSVIVSQAFVSHLTERLRWAEGDAGWR